jgi:hypothetical protein
MLTQNFCDGAGTCSPIPVLSTCLNTCTAGPPDVCN